METAIRQGLDHDFNVSQLSSLWMRLIRDGSVACRSCRALKTRRVVLVANWTNEKKVISFESNRLLNISRYLVLLQMGL